MNVHVAPSSEPMSLTDVLISAGLAPSLASLFDEMPQRVFTVDSRQPFRMPGSPANEVMYVRSGILSKFRLGGLERRIISLCFAGECILPRCNRAAYGIQAIVRSEVVVGKGIDFQRIVSHHPQLKEFFERVVERNEAICHEWLLNVGRSDCVGRIAHLLCETAVRTGAKSGQLQVPFTQQQIAEITGQTSVNVNRSLMAMERDGLFNRHGREILFSDWNTLRRVGSFDPAYLNI